MSAEIRKLIVSYFTNLSTHLLNKFGEFFPIAMGINEKGEIVPLHVYFGDEHPTSEQVIAEFQVAFKKLASENKFTLFAICSDVFIAPPYLTHKTDALEIRYQNNEKGSTNIYVPYKRNEKGILVFLESYEKNGSLDIF